MPPPTRCRGGWQMSRYSRRGYMCLTLTQRWDPLQVRGWGHATAAAQAAAVDLPHLLTQTWLPTARNCAQEKESELQEKQRELRQRLLVAGNAAAADMLRVMPLGFDWACDFKVQSHQPVSNLRTVDGFHLRMPQEVASMESAHGPLDYRKSAPSCDLGNVCCLTKCLQYLKE